MPRLSLPACLLMFAALLAVTATADEPLRRPIAVEPLASSRVVVANRSGSAMLVDVTAGKVVVERQVGRGLSDFKPVSNKLFLATDEAAHELLAVSVGSDELQVAGRLKVSPYPVSVRISSDGKLASVASLWSRRLTLLRIEGLAIQREVDLPFAPREQIMLPDGQQVIVFDSFGGRFVVVEIATGKIVLERDFPGHAVRGLVLSPDRQMLLASHQMLNPHGHVNQSDIHWGLLMTNDLRWMKLTSLLDPSREIYAGGRVQPLGVPGRGGGDPAGVAMTREGTVAVCLGGVNQLMIGKHDDLALKPVNVGRRPTAVCLSSDEQQAIVANTFDDTLSVVDLANRRVTKTIPLGSSRERSLVERGEELFHDARLSHEGWMSCHSCHTDGHSNFIRNDNLSDKSFGAPKLVLSLLGRKGTAPYGWLGSSPELASQIRSSVHKTMQSDRKQLSDAEVSSLAAYVESLPAPPSAELLRGSEDRAAIARGKLVFAKHDCAKCHSGDTYTSSGLEDVGLADERGERRFNPPPLLGAGQRDALLHDGRARSLEEVFSKHRHPHDQEWPDEEVRDLVAFLRSL